MTNRLAIWVLTIAVLLTGCSTPTQRPAATPAAPAEAQIAALCRDYRPFKKHMAACWGLLETDCAESALISDGFARACAAGIQEEANRFRMCATFDAAKAQYERMQAEARRATLFNPARYGERLKSATATFDESCFTPLLAAYQGRVSARLTGE